MRGYSAQNLWYMRQFFLEYHENVKLQPLVGEISWAKNLVIMGRCKDPLEREFYSRIRPARCPKAHWCGDLSCQQAVAKRTRRTVAVATGNSPTVGDNEMSSYFNTYCQGSSEPYQVLARAQYT